MASRTFTPSLPYDSRGRRFTLIGPSIWIEWGSAPTNCWLTFTPAQSSTPSKLTKISKEDLFGFVCTLGNFVFDRWCFQGVDWENQICLCPLALTHCQFDLGCRFVSFLYKRKALPPLSGWIFVVELLWENCISICFGIVNKDIQLWRSMGFWLWWILHGWGDIVSNSSLSIHVCV